MKTYIKANQEAAKRFFTSEASRPVTMLNLLRFRKTADYSKHPELAPDHDISGQEAYQKYIQSALPLLLKVGSRLIYSGNTAEFLIGPSEEKWDLVLLVEHPNRAIFMSFATDEEYLKIEGHRTAALEDSRLLPIEVQQL